MRILNFDDSLTSQKNLLERFHPKIIDLNKTGLLARHWLNRKARREIASALADGSRNEITFIGSGDYHHISEILISQFFEPMSLIIFDHHPDWDILPPYFGCGSWVSRVLEKNNILKVVSLGAGSGDLSFPAIQTANLAALKGGRFQIFPYAHPPTRVFCRNVPENSCLVKKQGLFYTDIYWQELKGKNLADFCAGLIEKLPTKKVYVSIDKDCLRSSYALTNWEEGSLGLEELLAMLRLIKERLEIVGMDICGEYSLPQVRGRIKSFLSESDRPKDYSAKHKPQQLIESINEETNLKIAGLF